MKTTCQGRLTFTPSTTTCAVCTPFPLRWTALTRYVDDGTLEIDNNIAERSLRGVGTGRKNFLFFGSYSGGERAAIAYSLIETCRLNRIDPQRYLESVLARIADRPINRIEDLLPWNLRDKLEQPEA